MGRLNRKTKPVFRHPVKRNSHVLKKLAIAFVIVLIALGTYIKVQPYTHDAKLRNELESKSQQLLETKSQLEQQQINSEQQFNEQQQRLQEVQQQLEQTQRELQAKRSAQKAYAAAVQNGSCADWMRMAGIPNTYATNKLILNESGCKPSAVNPRSGACGIPQAYPCGKLPCPLNNSGAVCQLQWMQNYVNERYGSWEAALSFWYKQCGTSRGCWY